MNIYVSIVNFNDSTVESSVLCNVVDNCYITHNGVRRRLGWSSLHRISVDAYDLNGNRLLFCSQSRNKLDQKMYQLKNNHNLRLI